MNIADGDIIVKEIINISICTVIIIALLSFIYKFSYCKRADGDDYEKFSSFFSQIRRDLTADDDHRLKEVVKRIDNILMYTAVDGKKFRGMTIVKCLKNMVPVETMTPELEEMSFALGWCLEITQAACLIYDDIMDNSLTRRGKQCWYLHKNSGFLAINDGSQMRFVNWKLLQKYFSTHPCYLNIINVLLETTRKTMNGQILDCTTNVDGERPDCTLINEMRYKTIVKYKTSYYTFVTPFRLTMYLANITDEMIHADAEELFLRIGHLFQAQDDYLDIYGDPNVTGKVGTDIEDGKCSWIAVQALKKMDEAMRKLFEESYGRKDRICVIKAIFEVLEMKTAFREFETKEFIEIQNLIAAFQNKHNLNMKSVNKLLYTIYQRQK